MLISYPWCEDALVFYPPDASYVFLVVFKFIFIYLHLWRACPKIREIHRLIHLVKSRTTCPRTPPIWLEESTKNQRLARDLPCCHHPDVSYQNPNAPDNTRHLPWVAGQAEEHFAGSSWQHRFEHQVRAFEGPSQALRLLFQFWQISLLSYYTWAASKIFQVFIWYICWPSLSVLDLRINYDELYADYCDDFDLLTGLEKSKRSLYSHYDKFYAGSNISASRNMPKNTPQPGSGMQVGVSFDFMARFWQKPPRRVLNE